MQGEVGLSRVPLLKVDGHGTVIAENGAAVELLGPSVGKPCALVVDAHVGGRQHCLHGCAWSLTVSGCSRETRRAEVAQSPVSLTCSAMGDEVVVAIVPARTEVPTTPLTRREIQVVELIARGHTNARIAKRLGVQVSTVRTHVERLLEKLGARSRAEAVTRAMATGQLRTD